MDRRLVVLAAIVSLLVLGCGRGERQDPAPARLEVVAASDRLWTGVAVSPAGRIFVNFPRWSADVPISVAEVLASGEIVPFPDDEWNRWDPDLSPAERFVCVQSVVCDEKGSLWIVDAGNPLGQGVVPGAAKLLRFDLETNEVTRRIEFSFEVAPAESYLNDVRIDTRADVAYVSESGLGAILVVDLAQGTVARRLADHPSTKSEGVGLTIGGTPWMPGGVKPEVHCDGIALDDTGEFVYYQALTGHTLYRVATRWLRDASLAEAELGEKVERVGTTGVSDGIIFGRDGLLYLSALEESAIKTVRVGAEMEVEMLVQSPDLAWPDSFALGADGTVYVTSSQIHLGPSLTTPYRIFKIVR